MLVRRVWPSAKLTDGVLTLELPKVQQARPRQITVRTG
jgi:HSP20 family molecular chaperone IbpA